MSVEEPLLLRIAEDTALLRADVAAMRAASEARLDQVESRTEKHEPRLLKVERRTAYTAGVVGILVFTVGAIMGGGLV